MVYKSYAYAVNLQYLNKFMSGNIKIHILHCGMVHTSPYLPYNTGGAGLLKIAGFGVPKKD